MEIVRKTNLIINILKPKYYFIETQGQIKKVRCNQRTPIPKTITYCSYGDKRMKPTDIWTNFDFTAKLCVLTEIKIATMNQLREDLKLALKD